MTEPMPSRRSVLISLVGLGAAGGSAYLYRAKHAIVNSALYTTVLRPGPRAMRDGLANILVVHVDRVPDDLVECLTAGSVIPGATESWITMNESLFRPEGAGLFTGASTLTFALRPELSRLRPPTMLLWGEKDTFGPPTLGEEMARLMPNARCEVVPDAGHLPWLDQLDMCTTRIRAFLES